MELLTTAYRERVELQGADAAVLMILKGIGYGG